MGTLTTFRTPKHRVRHKACANYLAQQNDSAWEDVRKAVLEELDLPGFITRVNAALDNPQSNMAEAITTISDEMKALEARR